VGGFQPGVATASQVSKFFTTLVAIHPGKTLNRTPPVGVTPAEWTGRWEGPGVVRLRSGASWLERTRRMLSLAHTIDRLRVHATHRPRRIPPLPGARLVSTAAGAIRTLVRGAGRHTVFMAADPPLGIEHYLPVIERLASEHRVVACELPGFGFSAPAATFDWSLEAYAATFDELLVAVGAERAILAPSCFTNLPALRFALDHPQRVAGFVAIQGPSWNDALAWTRRNDPLGLFRIPVAGQLLNWVASGPLERLWLDRAEPDAARRARIEVTRRERMDHGCLYCLASGLQATRRTDPFRGARLDIPSALIWGGADRSHGPTPPTSFACYLSGPVLFELPAAGHFPELTSPETLVQAVRDVAGPGPASD
jgi:pimeloyl-ACP methyl ester carboxylesterase